MKPSEQELSLKEKTRRLPNAPGVYLMKARGGQIIYIGKAKNLKNRVSSYFQNTRRLSPKIATMVELVADFEFHIVRNETEALLLEGRLIKEWRPKFNTIFTDDKQFALVCVDIQSELPRFKIVRAKTNDTARHFGPYPNGSEVRKTLLEMRRRFGILLNDTAPERLENGLWRLYNDMRAEIHSQKNEVSAEEYRVRVNDACEFLDGRAKEWLADLREKMNDAAGRRDYERAAALRDTIAAIEKTTGVTRKFARGNPLPAPDAKDAILELQTLLALPEPPRTMECFDISHISGTFVVASLVRFKDGRPDKENYRRFRIREFIGNDDFRSMEEVVARRYKRLRDGHHEFPRLIVIDGGIGQVRAAMKAFSKMEMAPPPLVGLAKREEQIIFPDEREPLTLPRHNPALQLVQRLRDEAHRFANTYNADLRGKKIRESILDDCPNLGKARKMALLAHFKNLKNLRNATGDDIAKLPNFGKKIAQTIVEFLKKNN